MDADAWRVRSGCMGRVGMGLHGQFDDEAKEKFRIKSFYRVGPLCLSSLFLWSGRFNNRSVQMPNPHNSQQSVRRFGREVIALQV